MWFVEKIVYVILSLFIVKRLVPFKYRRFVKRLYLQINAWGLTYFSIYYTLYTCAFFITEYFKKQRVGQR